MKFLKHILPVVTILFAWSLWQAAPTSAKTFPDVDPFSDVGRAVGKLSDLGIVDGKPNGNFAPKDFVTRAEAAKIMYGVLELENLANETGIVKFPDVKTTHWAYKYIMTMYDWEYLSGYPDGSFQPSKYLNRGEMASILMNTLSLPASSIKLPFTDVKTSAFYYKGVTALYVADITKGLTTTKFGPSDKVTRQQLALFLDRSGILDTLLGLEKSINIDKIEDQNGKTLTEAKGLELIATYKKDIFRIDNANYLSDAIYNETTNRFEEVSTDGDIFEIQFTELDLPVYVKVTTNSAGVQTMQFKTPTYLKQLASAMTGTQKLATTLNTYIDRANLNDAFVSPYLSVSHPAGFIYSLYLGNGLYYIEFEDTSTVTLTYDFLHTSVFGEILLKPTYSNGRYDFTIQ
jgi:hypothetical protein